MTSKSVRFLVLASLLWAVDLPLEATDSARDSNTEGAAAVVNGEAAFLEDLERELSNIHSGASEQPRGGFSARVLVDRVIDRILLSQEARQIDMARDEPVRSTLEDYRLQLAVSLLEEQEVKSKVDISEDDLRETFERDYQTATFYMLTARDREQAQQLLTQVQSGSDFQELAKEHSIDHHRLRGGYQEGVARIDIPSELASDLFTRHPGEIVGPIRTRIGWALLKLEEVKEADPDQFDAVRQRLYRVAAHRRTEEITREFLQELRGTHAVRVDQNAIDQIGAERLPDERLVPELPDNSTPIAMVGDREIDAEEFAQILMKRWKDVRNKDAAMAIKPLALDELIERHLLELEAVRRAYPDLPTIERKAHSYEIQLLSDRFLAKVVAPSIDVTEAEMRSYYDNNLDRFIKPPRLSLTKVTVETETEGDQIADLLRGGTDIAWLAEHYSIDGYKNKGGDIGWLEPIPNFNALHNALMTASVGDIVGPFGEEGHFEVFKVNAREEQGNYDFEVVQSRIRQLLFPQHFAEAVATILDRLRAEADISVDEGIIDSLSISGSRLEAKSVGSRHGQ